jgi:hypothetical protein
MTDSASEGQNQAFNTDSSPVHTEEMIPRSQHQAQLDAVAGKVRREERAKIDAYRNAQEYAPTQNYAAPPVQQSVDEGYFRKLAAEESSKGIEALKNHVAEITRKQQEEAVNQQMRGVLDQFHNKIVSAESAIPGISERVGGLNLSAMPHVIHLASTAENGAEVMDYIAQNPHIGTMLEMTASTQGKDAAYRAMNSLSQSLKINEKAKNVRMPNDPLSQIQPSPVNADNGKLNSVKDFRTQSWMR